MLGQKEHKMIEVFFYGLFMDQDLLVEKGLNPSNPRKGYVAGMGLRIGRRATLVHAQEERAYGIVMQLSEDESTALYSEESVSDYIPEQVVVTLNNGDRLSATCYNLPGHLLSGSNLAYAKSLVQVAIKCGLPQDYIDVIKQFDTVLKGK
jgi:hypothetical protein